MPDEPKRRLVHQRDAGVFFCLDKTFCFLTNALCNDISKDVGHFGRVGRGGEGPHGPKRPNTLHVKTRGDAQASVLVHPTVKRKCLRQRGGTMEN